MIEKLNKFLRTFFIVFGVLFVLLELMPEKKAAPSNKEGFDNEEFDDIW